MTINGVAEVADTVLTLLPVPQGGRVARCCPTPPPRVVLHREGRAARPRVLGAAVPAGRVRSTADRLPVAGGEQGHASCVRDAAWMWAQSQTGRARWGR